MKKTLPYLLIVFMFCFLLFGCRKDTLHEEVNESTEEKPPVASQDKDYGSEPVSYPEPSIIPDDNEESAENTDPPPENAITSGKFSAYPESNIELLGYLTERYGSDGYLTFEQALKVKYLVLTDPNLKVGNLSWVRHFPNLIELTVQNQHISYCTNEMNALIKLRKLDLSNNHISYIQGNDFDNDYDLHVDWGKLINLEYIDLSNNWLTETEPLAKCAKKLTYVNLSNNKIRDVTSFCEALQGGSLIDFRENYIKIDNISALTALYGRYEKVKVGMQFYWDVSRGLGPYPTKYYLWFFTDCKDMTINKEAVRFGIMYEIPKELARIDVRYVIDEETVILSKADFLRLDINFTECDICERGFINWQDR